jgi:hypothetical protein
VAFFSIYADQIKKRHRRTPEQIYDMLSSIYDLSDLMTRPLLLTMFVDVLLESKFRFREHNEFIGAAELYTTYINVHLDRDWQKGPQRQFLLRPERLEFARAAALTMFRSGGHLETGYESIAKVIADATAGEGKLYLNFSRQTFVMENMPAVINDVRVCSFLSITSLDRIQFSHKSFMEFFVADIIIKSLSKRVAVPLLGDDLTYEILYFVGSFCLVRSDYRLDILYHLNNISLSNRRPTERTCSLRYCIPSRNRSTGYSTGWRESA